MDRILILLVSYSIISRACGLDEFTYNKVSNLSGKVPSDHTPLSVRSVDDCAAACSVHVACNGFYYSETTRRCYLDTSLFTSSNALQEDNSAVYLAKSADVDASQRVVSSTKCPQTFRGDVLLLGSSGKYHTFTIVHTNISKDEAATLCNQFGLQLLKVNDITKIMDLADFLTSCDVYDQRKYWTDAEKQINEPGQPWRHSDGTEVLAPLPNVWCDLPGFRPCSGFRRSCAYMLRDLACYTKASVICE